MFNVNGQDFDSRREANSYAKTASSMFSGTDFKVTTPAGQVVAVYRGGRAFGITDTSNPMHNPACACVQCR